VFAIRRSFSKSQFRIASTAIDLQAKKERPRDMKNEIPRWGWYNAQLMFRLADALQRTPDVTLKGFFEDFRDELLNGIEFPLKNQGLAISSLYMLMVVPKEMWNSELEGVVFETVRCFTPPPQENSREFLRLLRNAVAHAHFAMEPSGHYRFWNETKSGKRNLDVRIVHSDLFRFIGEVGEFYINGRQQVAELD
jgi:hypothetical protein